ncbi:MAG: hypothetical protein KF844_08820 [Cryobacterium sp.]|nr:hypothetical protein [Cryobacterium sp.]
MIAALLATLVLQPASTRPLPADEVALTQMAERSAGLATASIQQCRETVRTQFAGKTFLVNDAPVVKSEAELIAPFQAHDAKISQARATLQKAEQNFQASQIDREALRRAIYTYIASCIAEDWQAVLNVCGNDAFGMVDLLEAEVKIRNRNAPTRAEDREPYDRQTVQSVVPRYEATRQFMIQRRASLGVLYWTWIRYAHSSIVTAGDGHHGGKTIMSRALVQQLGSKVRGVNSTLDFFVGFPGSPDRLILGMSNHPFLTARPYPNLQVSGSPTLLKLDTVPFEPLEKLNPDPTSIRMIWSHDESPSAEGWTLESEPTRKVTPVAYRADRSARLVVSAFGASPTTLADQPSGLSAASTFGRNGQMAIELKFDEAQVAVVSVPLKSLLSMTGSGVNRNLLEAQTRVLVGTQSLPALTENRLHVLRQSLILFIPGVFGSEISVRTTSGETTAFPAMSLNIVGSQPFQRLFCGTNGLPLPGNEASKLDLFRKYATETVYDIEKQPAILEPSQHPRIIANGRRLQHYILQPWPYDWRLRLEGTVNELYKSGTRAEGGSAVPPYRMPPGMQECLDALRAQNPLIDSKVVLVGHSTGGLIIRGAIKSTSAPSRIERAYFVNVPFWGAPKSYYVFMTGDMGIAIVANEFMRQMAPNAPIVYYLAPSEQFPGEVAVVGRNPVARFTGQDVGGFMRQLVKDAQALGLYPTLDPWNTSLELAARDFHRSIAGQPAIGWDRCRIFWSEGASPNTASRLFVDEAAKQIGTRAILGDGTVPSVSQKADWPASSLIENPARPLHVPAPNAAFVWEKIVDDLCRVID